MTASRKKLQSEPVADQDFDIVIAGGGMVGISLALQLCAVLPEDVSILLVESFPFPDPDKDPVAQYHPSFDARSTALSYSSRVIYEQLGAWSVLQERCAPIERIHVSTLGRFGNTVLDAQEQGWEALGYVAENAWLGNALIKSLYGQPRVTVNSPAAVVSTEPVNGGLRLALVDGQTELQSTLDTQLLLVADGAESSLREQFGVTVETKAYDQHALIANIATAQHHRGVAYERFTDEGPLAMLPLLPGPEGENRSALVWTLPTERVDALLACSDEEFLRELQSRFGYRLGRLLKSGVRSSYPLSLVQAGEQVRQHMVVMGNAAHALHPVAGQGFNLSLRDVVQLGQTLAEGIAQGESLGDLRVLERYQTRQAADQENTIGFSDRVPGLFMHSDPLLGLGRDLALAGLDILPPLKNAFVRQTAGMANPVVKANG